MSNSRLNPDPVTAFFGRPLEQLVHPNWLAPMRAQLPTLAGIAQALQAEVASDTQVLPAPHLMLRAFEQDPQRVRVLILGQDPYPTPGHAHGLAFSVEPHVRPLPRSLQNIYAELLSDAAVLAPPHGDLHAWVDAGVLLLNPVLSVRAGQAGSHRRLGWQEVTRAALRHLAQLHADGQPLVAVLWGNDAQSFSSDLPGIPLLSSAHPSPLSARRGFFGSRPFSRANELLTAQGGEPVDWWLS